MKQFRPSAVPLINVDPYFSIWSFSDNLYGDVTRHWTGRRNAMSLFFRIDQKWYKVMGNVYTDNYIHTTDPSEIEQKKCIVEATKTTYIFENDLICAEVMFRTPLLPDDLILMSSPVGYVSYKVSFKDGKKHDLQVYFDISAEICTDKRECFVEFGKTDYSVYCGRCEQEILKNSGDDKLIEWGYLHLSAPGASYRAYTGRDKMEIFKWDNKQEGIKAPSKVSDDNPVLSAWKKFGLVDKAESFLCVCYDDVYSIECFNEKLEPYWKSKGFSFEDIVKKAISEYEEINKKCDTFDMKLREEANKISSEYADILCLAYRQVISAHKLVRKDDKNLFFAKECYSNGCIGTVDVTYPSMPLFLCFNTELAEGLLNPIFKYVMENHGWKFEFAPHDIGIYPKANGQVYGYEKDDPEYILSHQMPVEECGNMLILTAAICSREKSSEYAADKVSVLKQWADYLVNVGYDPENQLCTDDFAGHLAHNCNLSVKAIIGIASFGYILNMMGEDGSYYLEKAKEYALKWEEYAFVDNHYKLAFNMEDSWSLKYNLVWDKFLGFDLFSEKVFRTEVEFYKTKLNKYGVPLDSRKLYTKSDWQMWTVCFIDDAEYRNMVIDAMWKFISETRYRVPFPDWYETDTADSHEFQARSVQGGLFMPLLFKEKK